MIIEKDSRKKWVFHKLTGDKKNLEFHNSPRKKKKKITDLFKQPWKNILNLTKYHTATNVDFHKSLILSTAPSNLP